MEKYFNVVSNTIKLNLAYRVNTFITMFSVFFSFGVMFYFWSSIYMQDNQVGSYSLQEILSYYVFVSIFELLIIPYIAWGIGDEIKNGQVTNIILKPINHLAYKFSQSAGLFLYRFMFCAPVILLVLYLLRNFLIYPDNKSEYLFFQVLVVFSYVLNFLIYYNVGIMAFWFDDAAGFYYACLVVVGFMQGQWLPLDLLPSWFARLSEYLPFKYLFFVPVSIGSGRIAFEYEMLVVPLIWLTILYSVALFMYKKGVKKYEGYGI